MVIVRGGGNAADVWNRHVHGILSSLGSVDFDGASLIGTACPHAVPHTPDGESVDPPPRTGMKHTRADTTCGAAVHKTWLQ